MEVAKRLRDTPLRIDIPQIEKVLEEFRPRFREEFPTVSLGDSVRSGREFALRALAPFGMELPPETKMLSARYYQDPEPWSLLRRVSNVTVKEPPVGADRSSGGRRRTLGAETSSSLSWWAAQDFENAILRAARKAQAEGLGMPHFVGSLATDPRVHGSLVSKTARQVADAIEHAQLRAARFAEELTYRDFDEIHPDTLKLRFLRVKSSSGPCKKCDPLNGKLFEVGQLPRLPLHGRCGCTLIPVVKGHRDRTSMLALPGGLAEVAGQRMLDTAFAYPEIVRTRIYSDSVGYLSSHVSEPAPVVLAWGLPEMDVEDLRAYVQAQSLVRPKTFDEDLSMLDRAGRPYTVHFTDRRNRLDLYPQAMETLRAPDCIGWNASNSSSNFYKRIAVVPGADARLFKVVVNHRAHGKFIQTWHEIDEDLAEANRKLLRQERTWFL